jgi:hypothetical protein
MFSKPLSDLADKYKTPDGQISLLYNVPMDHLAAVRKVLQEHFEHSKDTYSIRFRGPRPSYMQQSTLKKDATAFSVYVTPKRKRYTSIFTTRGQASVNAVEYINGQWVSL